MGIRDRYTDDSYNDSEEDQYLDDNYDDKEHDSYDSESDYFDSSKDKSESQSPTKSYKSSKSTRSTRREDSGKKPVSSKGSSGRSAQRNGKRSTRGRETNSYRDKDYSSEDSDYSSHSPSPRQTRREKNRGYRDTTSRDTSRNHQSYNRGTRGGYSDQQPPPIRPRPDIDDYMQAGKFVERINESNARGAPQHRSVGRESDDVISGFVNMENIEFIFNTKAAFKGIEREYNFSGAIRSGKAMGIKSTRIQLEIDPYESHSKTCCKLKNVKSFFEKRQKNHKIITNEFANLQKITKTGSTSVASHTLNDLRNRYGTSVPFDFNRVKLCDVICLTDSDYINATYVHSFNRRCAFITTQNPLEHTVKDFWIMVYENKSRAIFSLIDYNNKKTPMERYWPPEGTVLEYSEFEVHSLKKNRVGKITIRDLEIVPNNGLPSLKVRHFNYSDWSDMRSPPVMSECSLLVRNAIEAVSNDSCGPVIVHCGSGTGRSYVFLAMVLIQMQIEYYKIFDVYRTCAFLRSQRSLVFKDLPQYLFTNIYAAKSISLRENPSDDSLYTL